jgi:antitoxin component of MazEF toxin-antitoxin module
VAGPCGCRRSATLTWDTPRVYLKLMTKKLIQHGNSAALVIDKTLMDLLKVRMDTPLEVTTDGKNIIISPQTTENAEATLLQTLERINQKHGSVLSKLGK